ncbi:MAG TPA: hypothetical protein VKF61_01955 [Candidatus Polarisedimenticolia bacterium]|nr:hypothetical protein [Candidatus Polarisedimenticolia bacterium]
MKTIRNKTFKPLKLTFSGGKVLHLGPGKTGQIPDGALEQKSIQSLLKDAAIEILDGGPAHGPGTDASASGPHEATRGHRPAMTGPTKGQRGS